MFYAIVENTSSGKLTNFVTQAEFNTWARSVTIRRNWDIVGGFVYDISGDRSLVEHMRFWEEAWH